MTRLAAILIILFSTPFISIADDYPKNPAIDVLNYVFKIDLSDNTDKIQGEAVIDVRFLADGISVLRLDLIKASAALNGKGMMVTRIETNGQPLQFRHDSNALFIDMPGASQRNQQRSISVFYHGIPASGLKIANNKYGDRTFFSDNWPDKGRNWLPIVDHPYDKSTCEFIVKAPSHYQVVSNGLIKEETDLKDGYRITHWKQSVPIASWLYVLGVAKFAVQYVEKFDNKSIETWVYYQDREKGFYDFAEPTKQVLEFYSDYIGPFAYEKLANIQSNSVSGGMEAASAILYSESSVKGDRNERWRNVVIHEIAHQWFGNAVTEYDWDDVWLSEGFATYFTLLFIEHQYGRDAFLSGLADSKKRVDAFHVKNPGYRIIHDNLKDMSQVTSSHTYQKGSWILHMLRGILGTDVFWKGIRLYYSRYMNGSATTADFRRAMEEISGKDLKDFFEQWLYKPGRLQVKAGWSYDDKKKELTITVNQVQNDGSIFKMPLEIAVYADSMNEPLIHEMQLTSKSNIHSVKADKKPFKVVMDPNSWVLMDAVIEQTK